MLLSLQKIVGRLQVVLELGYSIYLCHDISLLRGLVGSWLTPDRYQEGGALGYKVMGRTQIHDSITINTINLPSCLCALPVYLNSMSSTWSAPCFGYRMGRFPNK